MNHLLLRGTVWHHRRREVSHSFSYPLMMIVLDLTAWDTRPTYAPLFGVDLFGIDRPALLSIRERDFLHESGTLASQTDQSLPDRLSSLIHKHGGTMEADQILLVTSPRILGYTFNPVNFYLFLTGGRIAQLVCEVNNTFGQTHRYVARCKPTERNPTTGQGTESVFEFPKEFCVSPFLDRTGTYRVTTNITASDLSITVTLLHDDAVTFTAGLSGTLTPLTRSTILRGCITTPGTSWLTMTRISLQALRLLRARVTAYPLLPLMRKSDTPRPRSRIEQIRLRMLNCLTRGSFFEQTTSSALPPKPPPSRHNP